MQLLAGDIGGTNSRLLCAEVAAGDRQIIAEKSYPSADFDGLEQVIDVFISEHGLAKAIDAACFAIAGPVESGVAKVTNLPWVIKQQDLTERLQTPRVKLINDLAAAAYGILELDETDLLLMQTGTAGAMAPENPDAVVVAAGTGLGAAHCAWLNDHYQIFSSEAGHTGFAAENAEQNELLAWLQKTNSHVSLEMLLSGRGLHTIYHFLHEVKGFIESPVVYETMQNADPAQVISQYGLAGDDVLCQKALDMFVDIYGAAAGDIVLHHYPVTELYVAGGIAPKIKDKMLAPRFIDAFVNKGLMSSNMKKVTVKLVMQEKAGLFGALSVARSSLVSR